MLYPKPCYNEPCYKEVVVYFCIIVFKNIRNSLGKFCLGEIVFFFLFFRDNLNRMSSLISVKNFKKIMNCHLMNTRSLHSMKA